MEDDIVEEDFGQTVVLTKRIKGVLRGYPEGTAVLKELLQNADDAGCVHALMIIYDVFFFHLIPRHLPTFLSSRPMSHAEELAPFAAALLCLLALF